MDALEIHGPVQLDGTIEISGSKNAALPIMAAALLAPGESVIEGVPKLVDIAVLERLLASLGVKVCRDETGSIHIDATTIEKPIGEYDIVRKMRASICILGPLLARCGHVEVSMPGGCAIGDRPVDIHLRGLRELGAQITLENGYIVADAPQGLKGGAIFLGGPFGSTVLGTANILMAATLAEGKTVIECAACEPEICDLANFLNEMGAKITGIGSPRLTVEGVSGLSPVKYKVIGDRIEAGTFMVAAAITRGRLELKNCDLGHMLAVVDVLRKIGVRIDETNDGCVVTCTGRLSPVDITTQVYPGFPTDLQAQLMALLALADGNSVVTEKIFPDRFMHVAELNRMAANIRKEGPTAIIAGVERLVAAPVMASDLRASAALVLAAMAAEGTTLINRVYHIDRGYERIEEKLNPAGASIVRKQVEQV
ncbi:UDP-N-acetylglucosamine 1-carboxyvinyltransferase [Anaerohalosphaera lusitana]|uniref:UDP-N-acetylglucosamine 1-carboxyvinyltransferase n=1 Tax=Anaerohalosphaera lusitana TaxID=1936003 RepID=A0A1U9NNS7_9BACT|nr:UDP-N-acetylglucosamine 1-carboxyvinyltransferase [Anaerohalosphaera lusitana]AQT69563.1 UDP-N-acetylglucosamine 1-carboxyvinyltransferase [Anaerohalosphaera lusitana]